jgi:bacteriocin-like protein
MTIRTITDTELAAVSGGSEGAKLVYGGILGYGAAMVSLAAGWTGAAYVARGLGFADKAFKMSRKAEFVTGAVGAVAGIAGGYYGGRYVYRHVD